MVVSPHPIDLTVNDADGNAKANVIVYLRNTNKRTSNLTDISGNLLKTDSNGKSLLDAANFPIAAGQTLEYDVGDKILIVAYDGANSDASLYTIVGDDHTLTLTLNPIAHQGPEAADSVRLMGVVCANTAGSVVQVKIFAVVDGTLLVQFEVPANDTRDHSFGGGWGKGAGLGFVVERGATTVVVTTTQR